MLALYQNKIIATFSGDDGLTVDKVVVFTAESIAREESDRLGNNLDDPAKTLSQAWVDRMAPLIKNMLDIIDPTSRQQILSKKIPIVNGFFASNTSDGKLELTWAYIALEGSQLVPHTRPQLPNPLNKIKASTSAKSAEAFTALKNSDPQKAYPAWKDRDAAFAVYLAEGIRDMANDPMVGGAVDAVELRLGKTAHWIRRKDCCRPD